jgi:Ca-activated chloride channel family protein
VSSLAGTLEVSGRIGDRPWQVRLPVANAAEGQGLSKVWARRKIADAEVARTLHQATPEEADRRILALALDHHLVSRLTSLVAVDSTPSRPAGAHLTRAELPLNLPAGWDFDKVFGTAGEGSREPAPRREGRTEAAPGVRLADAARVATPAAPARSRGLLSVGANQPGVILPKTATDAELRMMLGAALMMLGFLLLMLRRLALRTAG